MTVMALTCTISIADVPSSFSPFVEFKEKTQQWKLLGEYLLLLCFCCSQGWLFSPGLHFQLAAAQREVSRAGKIHWVDLYFQLSEGVFWTQVLEK